MGLIKLNYNDLHGHHKHYRSITNFTCLFLNTFKYIADNGKLYFVLNIVGGAFACYGSVLLNSLPFIILEGTWSVVALIGLIKTLKQ